MNTCEICGLETLAPCADAKAAEGCPHQPGAVFTSGPFAGLKKWHYGAIVADPPWTFLTRSDKGKDRSPEEHYDCMSLDDIKALPVRDLAAKNAALFMWVIDTHLPMALDVMEAWGFTYKTRAFSWVKLNKKFSDYPETDRLADADKPYFKGMGFWTRANPEDCLIGVNEEEQDFASNCLLGSRGRPSRVAKDVRRLIVAPVREHSRKPDEALDRVEALVEGPYVELFSRTTRVGWDQMGDEKGKFDPVDLDRMMEDLI